jgi:outer membrane protein assembly factor BamB
VLQATSVAIVGDRAVVSYNMRGDQYLGAIDVFDISNKNRPVLRSQALFQNADINSVSTFGPFVLAAEATGDPGFETPAVVEVMLLLGDYLVLDGDWRLPLTSYAATSVMVSGTRGYATSGDGGGLFAFDPNPPPAVDTIALHDARWVATGSGKVVVVQGTPGQIAVFDETTLAPLGTFPFTGADIAESKSTVDVVGGKAFIAAGSGGVQVLSASTGTVVGSVPRPDPAALGLDPSVVVTNACAADDDLLFISNGEAGVYVAQGSRNFADTGSETQQQITMLGKLQFGSLQSVNHVAYRNKNLIIAAGLGGLKIVQVN